MMRLYNAALVPLRLAVSAWAALPLHRPEVARRWRERLARRLPEADSGGIWVHGASVGEARITAALSAAVRPRFPWIPVCVSATTATGRAQLPTPP
ncbi:MAG TPA: glycosyltransferase N-terminal domain-containing protein, partial [Candidatus Polarisedimenticolaceae bacterium]|nr:glycosyltransferase N-terminal domain-containing protein [Candidatus Polarisedimenticolaceae bacterium]